MARRVHFMRIMKTTLLSVAALSLISVACAVEPFSSAGTTNAGESGSDSLSSSGAAGSPDAAGAPSVGGGGHAGSASSAGGKAGTAGSSSAGAGAGSAGAPPSGAAGAAAGAPSTAPSCSTDDAVKSVKLPGSFSMDEWYSEFAPDNVCWSQQATSCSFKIVSIGPSPINASRTRLSLSNIKCDAPLMYGTGTEDACGSLMKCGDTLDGSDSDVLVIDFDLVPDGDAKSTWYDASNIEMKGSDPGPGSVNCEINASAAAEELFVSVERLLSSTVFTCPGR
jgi:hypothetical protein